MSWELRYSSDDPSEVEWFASPTSGTIEPYGERLIKVLARTAGLNARSAPYVAAFALHSESVCVCRDQTVEMAIEIIVSAETSAEKSYVEVLHSDRVEAADQLVFRIIPMDDEGLRIEDSAEIQFMPILAHDEEDVMIVCSVVFLPMDNVHQGKCAMPTFDKIPLAGAFHLSVALSTGGLVGDSELGVNVTSCPKDWFYHRPTARCVKCDLDKSV